MDTSEFERLLARIGILSTEQRHILGTVLSSPGPEDKVRGLIEGRMAERRHCPHCGAEDVGKWGRASGLARYRCRACRRTFNALTNTPLARLRHKDRWLIYAEALRDGVSVRRAAQRCAIDRTTSFRWRHRFLTAPSTAKPTRLSGIVEADETFFRRSYKGSRRWVRPGPESAVPPERRPRRRGGKTGKRGTSVAEQVPVLVVRERSGPTTDFILPVLDKETISAALKPILDRETLLCTDGAGAYQAFAQETGIRHEPVNLAQGQRVRDGVFHIQNVNAYDSRLKVWMLHFKGVATRYLDHYLGWWRMTERIGLAATPESFIVEGLETCRINI